jgi:hypothetical protein
MPSNTLIKENYDASIMDMKYDLVTHRFDEIVNNLSYNAYDYLPGTLSREDDWFYAIKNFNKYEPCFKNRTPKLKTIDIHVSHSNNKFLAKS